MTKHEKIRTINRETCIILFLYALFFIWWYATAYGLGGGDPAEYRTVFGFPAWFFYSCIVGYVGISLILWAAVKFFFKEIPFDDEEEVRHD